MAKKKQPTGGGGGLPVDQAGGPAVDPTENVRALNEAGNKRQDDLRAAAEKRMESALANVEAMASLRAQHHSQMLHSEADRLDSIRRVDQANVQTAADRALAAIQTLAATTTVNADNLRNALNSTAAAIAAQTAQTVGLINERISALEKVSYKGEGKEAVADPMIAQLVSEMRLMRERAAIDAGRAQGISATWAVLIAVVGLIATLLVIVPKLGTTPAPPASQTIYVPSPAGTMLPTVPPGAVPR